MERVLMLDILLVEDDERLASLTKTYLEQNGLTVSIENRGDTAVARFEQLRPRMVLLDLMLPGLDGIEVCKQLRQRFAGPILMLTAKGNDIDQVMGLETGADDYVVKPADPMVLLARVRALLRRAEEQVDAGQQNLSSQNDVVLGGLRVNASAQSVSLHGNEVEFSTQEFVLLWELINSAGTILSRDELFKRIRGIEYDGLDRSVDVRVSKIRKKLGDDPNNPQKIKTVWGKGYLLSPSAWNADKQRSDENESRKEDLTKKVNVDKGTNP
ncbi:MAG: response regulator [Pseudomonadales bacterium]